MKYIVTFVLFLVPGLALALDFAVTKRLSLYPGENGKVIVQCLGECPVTFIPSPGKAHGGSHPTLAKLKGKTYCDTCHYPNTLDAKAPSDYSFCPSRETANFGNSTIRAFLGWPQLSMDGQQIPLPDGTFFRDKVTDTDIYCGGNAGCYNTLVNESAACVDCHMPHDNGRSVRSSDIHEGCLDCHRSVGSGDLRSGLPEGLKDYVESLKDR